MVFEEKSQKHSVQDYFVSKVSNKSALDCFGDSDSADYSGFNSQLSKYMNEKSISEMINVNSEISNILSKFKISIKINMGILNNLVRHHLPQTQNIALGIAKYIPQKYQSDINKKALMKATCLHDIAKVIMPEDIINKPGALNDEEREIMCKHADLSYEMLKTTDLDMETLNLIKEHHKCSQNQTNPIKIDDKINDINLQILSMADIYSALREKRCYKDAMTKKKALEIINSEVNKGKFHPSVYNALVAYSENDETLGEGNSKRQIFNFKSVNSFSA